MNAIAGNVARAGIWATLRTVQKPPNFGPPPPAEAARRRDDTPLVIFIAGRMPVTSVAAVARPTPYAIDIGGSVGVIQNGKSLPSFADRTNDVTPQCMTRCAMARPAIAARM